jgi:serine/threonine-protein kinase
MPTPSDSAAAPQSLDDPMVGRRVHKYQIVRLIGRGGMGMVYEGLNTDIGKRVAMKFVDRELAKNTEAVARFQREAKAASAVESAHIVQIFDAGVTEDGLPFLVMELLRGEDLGCRIERLGRLDLPEALHITAQILRGLNRAHEAGIVHRDLKPDNIFLVDRDDDASFAKILDFGISKVEQRDDVPTQTLTRQGTVLGTPYYMSPEQAQGLPDVDGRTDLWSVGAILYECLTGRSPHRGRSYEQVIVSICMNDADDVRVHNPGVSEPVAQVIARALQRDRSQRFASAQAFQGALASASGGLVAQWPSRRAETDPPGRMRSSRLAAAEECLAPTLGAASSSGLRRARAPSIPGVRSRRGLVLALAASSLVLSAIVASVWSARRSVAAAESDAIAPLAPSQERSAAPPPAEPIVLPQADSEPPAPTGSGAPIDRPLKSGRGGPGPKASATTSDRSTRTAPTATTTAEPAPPAPRSSLPAPPRSAPKGVAGGLELKTE